MIMVNKKTYGKSGQEEIIGFGIILLVIAVIFLVFLSFSNNKNQEDNFGNDEAGSFTKALMELTTTCEKNSDFLSVKDLIFECDRNYKCDGGEDSCEILEKIINESVVDSWAVGKDSSIKGYELNIRVENKSLINLVEGNFTLKDNYKGARQNYAKSGDDTEIQFKIYIKS